MKFKALLTVLTVVVMSFFTFVASAGFTWSGGANLGSLIIEGYVRGLGNSAGEQLDVIVNATGVDVGFTCTNKGGREAPGQNRLNFSVTEDAGSIDVDTNGRAYVYVELDVIALSGITDDSAGCPNGNWTVTAVSGGMVNFSVALVDSSGTTIESISFECEPAPSGSQSGTELSCTEV